MGWKGIFLRASLGVLALSAALVVFAGYEYYEVFGGGEEVYETIPPDLPAMKPTAILIFTKTNGFRHGDSIAAGTKALVDLISNRGWSSFVTDNAAVFNQAQLAKFKAVICNNTSGNNLLPAQQAAFTQYMTDGGGFVGIHASGGDPSYKWRWYVDTLIGAQFKGHPLFPEFQRATLHVEDLDHPATRHLGSTWVRTDEWYSFERSPRDHVHVLATLDEHTYSPKFAWKDISMGRDHPIIWTHCIGRGRAFYSALGHTASSYSEPQFVEMLGGAISWAAGLDGPPCPAQATTQ